MTEYDDRIAEALSVLLEAHTDDVDIAVFNAMRAGDREDLLELATGILRCVTQGLVDLS